jgi:hypothetical protein
MLKLSNVKIFYKIFCCSILVRVSTFYSHIHAHLMQFDIAILVLAQVLAETCRGEEEQKR